MQKLTPVIGQFLPLLLSCYCHKNHIFINYISVKFLVIALLDVFKSNDGGKVTNKKYIYTVLYISLIAILIGALYSFLWI